MLSNRAYAIHDADEPGERAGSTSREVVARPPVAAPERAAQGAQRPGWPERALSAYCCLRRSTIEVDRGEGVLGAASLIGICVGSVLGWALGLLALWGFFNVI